MDRRPMRSGDRLDAIIRQALEERVAHSQPPAHARHALIGQIRESTRRSSTAKSGSSTLHGKLHPVSTVMRAYNSGSGSYQRDSHLSQAITSFTSPMLGLMR